MGEVLWHEGPVVTGGGHPFEFCLPTAARYMRRRDDEIAIAHVHLDLIAKSAFSDKRLGNPYSPRIADWDDIDFQGTRHFNGLSIRLPAAQQRSRFACPHRAEDKRGYAKQCRAANDECGQGENGG